MALNTFRVELNRREEAAWQGGDIAAFEAAQSQLEAAILGVAKLNNIVQQKIKNHQFSLELGQLESSLKGLMDQGSSGMSASTIDATKAQLSDLIQASDDLLLANLSRRQQSGYIVYASIVSAFVAVIVIGVLFFLGFYRSTISSISDLKSAAFLLAEGDLSARVPVRGSDEMSAVARCFNQIAEEFAQILMTVIRRMELVQSNTLKMQEASAETSYSVSEQSVKVDRVVDALLQLTESHHMITDITQRTANYAETAREKTVNNITQIRQAFDGLAKMADDFNATTQSLSKLEEESHRIKEVLASIREIADQTNLLALNAAIEAARAGEMGRGFAVVSDEVRALAEKTQLATSSVSDTISALEDSIETSIQSSQISYNNMKVGIEQAAKANELVAEVSEQISEIHQLSQQIADQMHHNSEATLVVSHTIQEIKGISESAQAAVLSNAESCGELSALTEKLSAVLSHFAADSSEDAELF